MDGNTVLLFSLLWTSANITVNRKKDLKNDQKAVVCTNTFADGQMAC